MAEQWSFSRISAYEQCPYQYYLQYKEKRESIDNFYASFGSLMHRLLEQILNGEMTYEDAVEYYTEYYKYEICPDAPSNLIEKYFDKGLDYLAEVSFDWIYQDYDILGVEKEVHFKIGKHNFVGFIDLLLKEKNSGKMLIVDHKSSQFPLSKTGKLLKSCAEQEEHYENQMYLYSKAIYDEYGEYPAQLSWNYFKEKKWYSIPFSMIGLARALQWASDKIADIEKDGVYESREDFFYCNNLCGFRKSCEYRVYESEDNDGSSSSAYQV